MKHHFFRLFSLFFCGLLLLGFTACSLFGSGSKKAGEDDLALSEADLEKRYAMGNIPLAESEGMFRDVHFDYDSSGINDAARQTIEYNLQVLQSNPAYSVRLEGHCDERGTAEYNLALGAERARAVRDVLTSYGISANRISTITYGEEIPLDPGHDEFAYAKNRRVHFALSQGSSGER
ncbi:MAG: peptidoglycan-associated lipoprotein Pal [Deltaproteobacteria bacterium]|nr:peptidoglycan-associated lipoprotein Pal [Deltaproteobacteria bacterium]